MWRLAVVFPSSAAPELQLRQPEPPHPQSGEKADRDQPSENRNYEVVSDRRFLYDGWNLVAELEMNLQHSSFALHTSYAWGIDLSDTEQGAGGVGGLLCISRATENGQRKTSLPTYGGNGNVLALYDLNSQTLTARYEYGPFGETLVVKGPTAAENAFRFSTKYTDEETGLLYYGYRYYSAELGRWTARDPISVKGGLNLFGMVGNEAVNRVDVLGLVGVASFPTTQNEVSRTMNAWTGGFTPYFTPQHPPLPTTRYPASDAKGVPKWKPQSGFGGSLSESIFHGCDECYRDSCSEERRPMLLQMWQAQWRRRRQGQFRL